MGVIYQVQDNVITGCFDFRFFFVREIKVLELRNNIQWTMATANLHHSAPANLDHPLYLINFIRSCTSPRPVTPGDAISAATLSVPPQHNLLFVTRVQGIEWWSLVTKR